MKLEFKVPFPKKENSPSFPKLGPFQRRLSETRPRAKVSFENIANQRVFMAGFLSLEYFKICELWEVETLPICLVHLAPICFQFSICLTHRVASSADVI